MKKPLRSRTSETKQNKPKEPGDYSELQKRVKPVSSFTPEVKVVFYGKPGTGKTTLACTFPKALLVDISEKGSDSVRRVKGLNVLRVADWDDLDLIYWMLKDNKDGYKSVIIDTMSSAQGLAIQKVMDNAGKTGEIGGWGTMTKQMWGEVSSMLKSFILNIRDLPLNVAFIAHDKVFNVSDEEDESGGITPSVGPNLMPSIASTLNAAVGVIGNTFIRERFQKKIVLVGGKKKTKETKITEYCLRIGPHSYYITKVRAPRRDDAPELLVDADFDDIHDLIMGE